MLTSKRLLLRNWKESDLPLFRGMNGDERVMEFFPNVLTGEESDALAMKIQREMDELPYGLWAVEVQGGAPFIGFIGLHYVEWMERVEVGWRLAYEHWGKGYATEGAQAAVDYGLQTLGLEEIVSFTAKMNERSVRVMERIGMKRDEKRDFHHPAIPKDHPLAPHVLYSKCLNTK